MEGSFSPILRKIAAEVVSKPKRTFTLPTEVCLEEWWLSKPATGGGLAVSGRPFEIRKCDDARANFSFASPTRRYASREFHSVNIVKRHGGTMLETSDGLLVSLCGFINKSRTQQNGFSSEVCRDFINGFPFNWDDYTAQSAKEGWKSNECSIDGCTPAALDCLNGAELHDLMLSFTHTDRDLFIERINNLMLNTQAEHGVDIQLPNSSLAVLCCADRLTSGNNTVEASMRQLTDIDCSTPARSSLLGADVSTPENRITSASKKRKQKASPHATCDQAPKLDQSVSKASKKPQQNTLLDVSLKQYSRRRSMRLR